MSSSKEYPPTMAGLTGRPREGGAESSATLGGLLRLAVFDCDGTLVDSEHTIVSTMHVACDVVGAARPEATAIRRVIGLPLLGAIAQLLPASDDAIHVQICDAYKMHFSATRQAGAHREELYPGIRDCIDALDREGWLLGVATGKSTRGLTATLGAHGLLDRFCTLQTADVAQGKPHPDMLLRAMSETGCEPAATVMIGDTTFDMEMARHAGTRAVGVAWGYHDPAELLVAGAEIVVSRGDDLAAVLRDMLEGV